jgi:tetratricopeptide (TPR) repeat protein
VAADLLPADLPAFTGRAGLLDRTGSAYPGGPAVWAFEGMAGIGKTALAVRLGHLLLRAGAVERALFVDLRGHDPEQPPADPAAALGALLRLLGVPGGRVPHTVDRRRELYVRVLAGTRTLLLLDNAAGPDQVAPLLPEESGCLVLVTSRSALAGLPRADRIEVPEFSPAEALDLLRRTAGTDRVAADPATATRIAALVGHLPLALAIVASHLRDHPDWALADYPPALTALAMAGGVRAALTLSDGSLAGGPRQLLRLLSLHPGRDLDADAATALAGRDARADLDALTAASLLRADPRGRWSGHDLTRAYAAERACLDVPTSQLRRALDRLYDHYADTASAAIHAAYPFRAGPDPGRPDPGRPDPGRPVPSPGAAASWLDAELDNLLAAAIHAVEHGRPDHAVRQSATLHRHLRTRGRYPEAGVLHGTALRIARERADRTGELAALLDLGHVRYIQGSYDEAGEFYADALRLAGDPVSRVRALSGYAAVHHKQGRIDECERLSGQAMDLAGTVGDRYGEQQALFGLAQARYLRGDQPGAATYYARAGRIAADIGDRHAEQIALIGEGNVRYMLGEHAAAVASQDRAVAIARTVGDRQGELQALAALAHAHAGLAEHRTAAARYDQALRIAEAIGDRNGEQHVLAGLGQVLCAIGDHEQAARRYARALAIGLDTGNRNIEYEAREGLGRCHAAAGRYAAAIGCHAAALTLATDLGQPDDRARAHDGLARAHTALGRPEPAREHWQAALALLDEHGLDRTYDPAVTAATIRSRLAAAGGNRSHRVEGAVDDPEHGGEHQGAEAVHAEDGPVPAEHLHQQHDPGGRHGPGEYEQDDHAHAPK